MPVRLDRLLAILCLILLSTNAAWAQSGTMPVMELFTSQGCSSCPPADALLKTYAVRSDIVALTLPVDYWDYLGWKDTLASAKYSKRQRHYSKLRNDGKVYTPQVVVNGMVEAVGSRKDAIDRALEQTTKKLRLFGVSLGARSDGKTLTIDVGGASDAEKSPPGTIWLAVVQPEVSVTVSHGENKGKKLTYYNVVRELSPVGMWSGSATTIELPQGTMMSPADERCAVLLQREDGGQILAATWMIPR